MYWSSNTTEFIYNQTTTSEVSCSRNLLIIAEVMLLKALKTWVYSGFSVDSSLSLIIYNCSDINSSQYGFLVISGTNHCKSLAKYLGSMLSTTGWYYMWVYSTCSIVLLRRNLHVQYDVNKLPLIATTIECWTSTNHKAVGSFVVMLHFTNQCDSCTQSE